MKIAIDLHIHSALSPCSDDDMTPNNIVNMAVLNGLDAIAITDHNSCDNVESVMKAAEGRIIVIPGMELQTIEEVHMLSYFTDLYSLLAFSKDLEQYYDGSPNRPEFFGHQLIMDEKDEIIGEKKQSLITSLSLTFDKAVELIKEYKGLPVPAHINKPSYSVLSQLGFLPPDLGLLLIEYSRNHPMDFQKYPECNFFFSSDAHFLGHILGRNMTIFVESLTINGVLQGLINTP
ncbi:MAG: PHP domain-containing protein [Caldicoprobacterales bacterium]